MDNNVKRLFREVASYKRRMEVCPPPPPPRELLEAMAVLADALEDAGADRLAAAYRWAAARGRWPFRLAVWRRGALARGATDRVLRIYDWQPAPGAGANEFIVPPRADISHRLGKAIRLADGRKYGGVHRAFVLIADALAALGGEGE